jgi:hypothetical protein
MRRLIMLGALFVAACASSTPGEQHSAVTAAAPADPAAIERDARDAARKEIARGRPVIWVIGRLPPNALPDPATGLPRYGFDCAVSPENEAARDAHNDEIHRALRAGEISSPPR